MMAGFQPVMSHVMAGHVSGQDQTNHAPMYDEQTPLAVVESSRPRQIYGCGFSFEERLHRKENEARCKNLPRGDSGGKLVYPASPSINLNVCNWCVAVTSPTDEWLQCLQLICGCNVCN
ncbi:hypothetical protein RRG08_066021 [Elysia crispata]|uniref:Uncharacterized protein n=1 Tax=Elysia crispata TaxID=231223 RepID=A0AAE0Z033_9GAST|nr:hypothetical protein RRG08_066021 [Elysia crispata]